MPNNIPFNSYNLAPADDTRFANDNFTRGCRIVSECGIGLTRYGFYLCGAGASVDRVFGFGIGISSLREVTRRRLFAQRGTLCRLCGHYKGKDLKVHIGEEVSENWVRAYSKYRVNQPRLRLYGSSSACL
jgi:hypothetical protein